MAVLTIPLTSATAHYRQATTLDGDVYSLDIAWNIRGEFWSMTISDSTGNPILAGIKLVGGVDLLQQYVMDNRPPGELNIIDTSGLSANPGRDDLGDRFILEYTEATG